MDWLLQTTIANRSLIAPFINPGSDVIATIELGKYMDFSLTESKLRGYNHGMRLHENNREVGDFQGGFQR